MPETCASIFDVPIRLCVTIARKKVSQWHLQLVEMPGVPSHSQWNFEQRKSELKENGTNSDYNKGFLILSSNNFISWFGVISSPKRIRYLTRLTSVRLAATVKFFFFSLLFLISFVGVVAFSLFGGEYMYRRCGSWQTSGIRDTRFGRSVLYVSLWMPANDSLSASI